MDIAIPIDGYEMQCGVLITSILYTNKYSNITFHILAECFSDIGKMQLQKIVNNTKAKIIFHQVDSLLFNNLPDKEKVSVGCNATYFKLFYTEIFSNDIKKILTLDCDMVVVDSLEPLWNTDITDYPAAAAIDVFCDDVRHRNRVGYNRELPYCNCGLVLINLDYWRKNNIYNKISTFLENKKEKILFSDQDVLNPLFAENWKVISSRYNLETDFLLSPEKWLIRKEYHKDILEARNNPCIIHFLGLKPWYKECIHPFKKIWCFFQNKTIWNGCIKYQYHGLNFICEKAKQLLRKIPYFKKKYPGFLIDQNFDYKLVVTNIFKHMDIH